jgi:HEAT repeat protein
MPESIEEGIVNASITVNTLGFGIGLQTIYYTGILLDDRVVMISDSLDDCFIIERSAMQAAAFTAFGNAELQVEKKKKYLGVDAVSILAFKQWCGRPVNAMDMDRLKKDKQASVTLLRPYLQAEEVQLRAAAVSALGALSDPEARGLAVSFLNDPAAPVRAGAVDACRQMKLTSILDKVVTFISDPEPALRIAAVQYLAAFPSEKARTAIEKASAAELVPSVKKEILKAQGGLAR